MKIIEVKLTDYDCLRAWKDKDQGTSSQRMNRWRNRAYRLGLPRNAATLLRDKTYALLRNDRHYPKEHVDCVVRCIVPV